MAQEQKIGEVATGLFAITITALLEHSSSVHLGMGKATESI